MNITIIGSGSGGCSLAAYLAAKGEQVTLYADKRHAKNIKIINKNRGISYEGDIHGFVNPYLATTFPHKAFCNADIFIFSVPSFAQQSLFKQLIPYLRKNHIVISLSGNFSTLFFMNQLQQHKINFPITIVETNSIPLASRVYEPGKVFIFKKKHGMRVSIYPFIQKKYILNLLAMLFDMKFYYLNNLLGPGLMNTNTIFHTAIIMLNISWVESTGGDFYFVKEGIGKTMADILERMDQEKMTIGNMYDMKLPKLIDTMYEFYNFKAKTIHEFSRITPVHNQVKGTPISLNTRYITEDVPYGLVTWHELSKKANIDSNITNTLIQLANIIKKENYFKSGRTLKTLGLHEYTHDEIVQFVSDQPD